MYVDLQFFPTGMQQAKLQSSVNLSFFGTSCPFTDFSPG